MNREALEHNIRAVAAISGDDEIIVVGSQSILGQYPRAPVGRCKSNEADVYPRNQPELADLIDGSIGELLAFHDTFGYYGQGVAPGTATVPAGWESRLVAVRNQKTRGATGWCLEAHDLVPSKYAAGREKVHDFVATAIGYGLVEAEELLRRLDAMPVNEAHRARMRARITSDARSPRRPAPAE